MTMNGNPAVDSLIGELSPELKDIIVPPPNDPSAETAIPLDPGGMTPATTVFGDAPPTERPVTQAEFKAFQKAADEQNTRLVSPALKRLGEISRLVPGAESLRIYKMQQGTLAYVKDLAIRDVKTSGGDLEAHLARYIVPTFKEGEYHISIVDPNGKLIRAGMITFAAPPTIPQEEGVLGLLRDQLAKQEAKMNQPTPDPIDQMIKMQQAIKMLSGGKENASMDPMQMMLMMQMMSPKPAQPAIDPTLAAIVDRMDRRLEAMEKERAAAAAMPALAPALPAIPESPISSMLAKASLPELVTAIAGIATLFRAKEPDPNALSVKELIPLLTQKPQDDRPGWRELFQLLENRRQEEKPAATLVDQMQAFAQIRQFAEELAGPAQPQGSTFWDALGALFSQEKFGANLGQAIGSAIQRREAPRLPAPGQSQVVQNRPAPQPAPRAVMPATTPATAPTQHTAQPQQSQRIYLPDTLKTHCQTIEAASSDPERVQAVVVALTALYPIEQWQKFVQELLERIATNDKQTALNMLRNWLGLLVQNSLLTAETATKVLQTMSDNWVEIHAQLAQRMGRPVLVTRDETGEPVSAVVDSNSAVAPAAPVPTDSSESEDDDDEFDPDTEKKDEDGVIHAIDCEMGEACDCGAFEDGDESDDDGDEDEDEEEPSGPQFLDLSDEDLEKMHGG